MQLGDHVASLTLDDIVGPYSDAIEEELRAAIPVGETPRLRAFYDIMRYHLGWLDEEFRPVVAHRGKMLRSALCILACEAAGGEAAGAVPAGAAIELVHNFSLVHDDIEDRSEFRRHRPTVWRLWGIARAINVGDAMLILSRQILTRRLYDSLGIERAITMKDAFDRAILAICEGQELDLSFETTMDIDVAAYLQMIERKTARLIEASCTLGAMAAGADDRTRGALAAFGRALGLAFQVWDDILGIWGATTVTGKPSADDVQSRKKSFPIVHALSEGTEGQRRELAVLFTQDALSDAEVAHAVEIIERTGAQERAREQMFRYRDEALDALDRAQVDGPAARKLGALAPLLTQRTH